MVIGGIHHSDKRTVERTQHDISEENTLRKKTRHHANSPSPCSLLLTLAVPYHICAISEREPSFIRCFSPQVYKYNHIQEKITIPERYPNIPKTLSHLHTRMRFAEPQYPNEFSSALAPDKRGWGRLRVKRTAGLGQRLLGRYLIFRVPNEHFGE